MICAKVFNKYGSIGHEDEVSSRYNIKCGSVYSTEIS
jgi:hypothetical protein